MAKSVGQQASVRTDAARAALLEESIKREKRALHAFLREQEALAAAAPPPADQAASTPQSATCPPFHEEPVREQPAAAESRAAAEPAEGRAGAVDALSRHLWAAVNPGYCPAGGEKRLSVQRADYTWDAAEVARIREFDATGKRFNRRRNDVSDHHAALVKFRHLTKPSGGGRNAAAA